MLESDHRPSVWDSSRVENAHSIDEYLDWLFLGSGVNSLVQMQEAIAGAE